MSANTNYPIVSVPQIWQESISFPYKNGEARFEFFTNSGHRYVYLEQQISKNKNFDVTLLFNTNSQIGFVAKDGLAYVYDMQKEANKNFDDISLIENNMLGYIASGGFQYLYDYEELLKEIFNVSEAKGFDIVRLIDKATFITNTSVVMCGDRAHDKYIDLVVKYDANVQFLNGLTIRDVNLKMKPRRTCDNDEEWLRPKFVISKKFKFEGEINFKAEYDNEIKIDGIIDVSNLEKTQMHFNEHYDYITFSGKANEKSAVVSYYNPDDADGITDILKIKNANTSKKDLYIKNIRDRLKKLFVGDNALLKGLRFRNMKIYNYFDVITPDIKEAIIDLGIVIENIQ